MKLTPIFSAHVVLLVLLLQMGVVNARGGEGEQEAGQQAQELAKAAQNPVADLISIPFQNNTNFNFGPLNGTQNVLNIQPVIPVNLTPEWNLITRTIFPVISQPPVSPGQNRDGGFGDIQLSLFLSPAKPKGLIWGVGPIAQLDTASEDKFGQGKWGLGPTAVALKMTGPWVLGALINNVWSVAGDRNRQNVNQMLIQPFINYNLPSQPGGYFTFSPIITANWEADSGQKWTVPLGLGVGQIMRWGKLPVNVQTSAYVSVVHPDLAPNWQIRFQIAILLPKQLFEKKE
jgi:hypothetical protein